LVLVLVLTGPLLAPGCAQPLEYGQGPGGRRQELGLTPEQEVALGRKAYQEILNKSQVEPKDSSNVRVVTRVGQRIADVAEHNIPLQREIHLRLKGYQFEWEFNVIRDRHINAFCLPGGKVAVYTGLLPVTENEHQLATVMSHEIAHALAHHASERVARAQKQEQARRAMGGIVGPELAGILAAGTQIGSLKYDRQQEAEADHIGIFLMTFAGFDPDQAVVFWRRMAQANQGGHVPEILSDHPSDEARIKMMKQWVPLAKGGYQAYKEGRIAPGADR
jgi:predicted Zn-dependent protease